MSAESRSPEQELRVASYKAIIGGSTYDDYLERSENGGITIGRVKSLDVAEDVGGKYKIIQETMLSGNQDIWSKAEKLLYARSLHISPPQIHTSKERIVIAQLSTVYKINEVADMLKVDIGTVLAIQKETAAALSYLSGEANGDILSHYYNDFERLSTETEKAKEILGDERFVKLFNKYPVLRVMVSEYVEHAAVSPLLDRLGIQHSRDVNSDVRGFILEGRRSPKGVPTLMRNLTFTLAVNSETGDKLDEAVDIAYQETKQVHPGLRWKRLSANIIRFAKYIESDDMGVQDWLINYLKYGRDEMIERISLKTQVRPGTARRIHDQGVKLIEYLLLKDGMFDFEEYKYKASERTLFIEAYRAYVELVESCSKVNKGEAIQQEQRQKRRRVSTRILIETGL